MTPAETRFFQLIDDYARTRHRCFLAEMNPRTRELGYSVCFRPLSTSPNPSGRYACKYLMVSTEHVEAAGHGQELPPSLVDQLDAELSELTARGDSLRGAEH
jgi:hypothetical protein